MEDELDAEDVVEIDLTAAQQVAADEAMLLDLGGAEEIADLIARQSLGEADSVARQSLGEADSVADARPVPVED